MSFLKNPLIIIGVTLGFVILINLIIILGFRQGKRRDDRTYRAFGQAMNLFRNPWKKETEQIDELSTLLESIEEQENPDK